MQALTYSEPTRTLALQAERPLPVPGDAEVLIRVLRAGICSTDWEICNGYVPGFNGVLGHEFVGQVVSVGSSGRQDLHGKRVVGEINCNDCKFSCVDAVFQRNHAPGRSVLGIINRDGTMAQYLALPAANCHIVPDSLTDQEAVYAEPLAAACRILEQGLPKLGCKVAIIGDGKIGLLVAQVLACSGRCGSLTLIGRHDAKMHLVTGGTSCSVPASPEAVQGAAAPLVIEYVSASEEGAVAALAGIFDMTVEASGSSQGIRTALSLCRPMGTILLKSTVSASHDVSMPGWSELANDIVVNEKVLVGSRCGPFDVALSMLSMHAPLRQLVNAMTQHVFNIRDGEAAMAAARTKGTLKVQLEFS